MDYYLSNDTEFHLVLFDGDISLDPEGEDSWIKLPHFLKDLDEVQDVVNRDMGTLESEEERFGLSDNNEEADGHEEKESTIEKKEKPEEKARTSTNSEDTSDQEQKEDEEESKELMYTLEEFEQLTRKEMAEFFKNRGLDKEVDLRSTKKMANFFEETFAE